ncbi:MAG TPA: MXAN_5187 family protein [Anaeromyxobacteraceae bacterium]|nr:MXAN_5187 family protein [Anaeromyxobacteraceae bacterium]
MTRWKVWVVVGLALGAGAASLAVGSARWGARQLEQVDRNLSAARAQIELSQAVLARQVEAVALAAARDPALLAALGEPAPSPVRRKPPRPVARPDPGPIADGAVKSAARAMGVDLSRGMVSALAGESGLRKDPAQALLAAAVAGSARQGHVRYGDTVYYAGAAPVQKGTALLFGLPIDSQWTEALEAATAVRVVLFSGPGKPNASLPAGEAEAFGAAAAKPGGVPASVGRLGPVKPSSPGFLPALPLLFVRAPALRLQGLPLAGLPGAALVLAAPTLPALAPLAAWQQLDLAGLLLLLVVAAVLTFLPGGGTARWPRELTAAAERIGRGDFAARVPRLAGPAGKLGAALNRAAEAAAEAAAAPASEAAAAPPAPEPPARPPFLIPEPAAAPPPPVPAEDAAGPGFPTEAPRAPAAPAAPIPAASTTGKLDASELFGAGVPAAPVPGRTGTARFGAASAPPAAAPPAGPAPATPEAEEEHWRQVFQDFLKVREQCREPAEGLTYERFRQKLQKNKESLVQKYSCRAVRFQVYVKDGKTALKATPVR